MDIHTSPSPLTTRQGLKPSHNDDMGAPSPVPSPSELARHIDHTLLKANAHRAEIITLCDEARAHNFFSVCVNATNVALAKKHLTGSSTCVCAVVGFPLGATSPSVKAFEASCAIAQGASEIDMVLNIGALKSQDLELVSQDILAVVQAAAGKTVKVILECAMLTQQEIVIACSLAKGAGAHFVKTSTGFGPGGAKTEDLKLMRSIVGNDMGVKASGGIRDYNTAVAMIQAGASRLGCSASVSIVSGNQDNTQQGGY